MLIRKKIVKGDWSDTVQTVIEQAIKIGAQEVLGCAPIGKSHDTVTTHLSDMAQTIADAVYNDIQEKRFNNTWGNGSSNFQSWKQTFSMPVDEIKKIVRTVIEEEYSDKFDTEEI